MSPAPRFRAWRFLYPGVDAVEDLAGLRIGAKGAIDMVQEDDSVRQAILLLLSTTPGERVMRPDYGCLLRRLIFSPNDETTAGLAIFYVRSAIERWEPRIEVLQLDAERDPELVERLNVNLVYRVRATRQIGRVVFPLDLAGAVR
jgi:phage baseplate assembly protein W